MVFNGIRHSVRRRIVASCIFFPLPRSEGFFRPSSGDMMLDALQMRSCSIESFLDYSNKPGHQSSIGRIPSADHSAAIRVRVLIKFIQVMRECQDADSALLIKACDCLKYWSDWLLEAKHYSQNNHGLMGSIALTPFRNSIRLYTILERIS